MYKMSQSFYKRERGERERGEAWGLERFFWLMVIDGVVEIFKFSSKPEFTISYTSYVQNLC